MNATPLDRLEVAPPPPALGTTDIVIESVQTAADRDAFIKLQLELYASDPNYIAPIVAERRDFLDQDKNPFLAHAELQLFLARRGSSTLGRIAAINDPNYNQFHNTEYGFFGMFECVNDPIVAGALFDAATEWLRAKGFRTMLGPVNLSLNHECGLLVEGFDQPAAMMMAYNPRFYPRLFEANGLQKHKDLWSYELSTAMAPPENVVRVANRLRFQEGVNVRPLNMRDLPEEIRRIKSVYNAMLDQIWSFVPMSEGEFDLIASRLRPLVQIRPELCLFAEIGGQPVAFSLTLPDANMALKAAHGYLTSYGFPLGLAKLAWAARKIDRVRVLMLMVKPAFQNRGIDALLYVETLRAARELGYTGGELGWTAEDDHALNRSIESMGARHYKTFRIYEKTISV